MGCDIHLYLEKKDEDAKWHQIIVDERLLPDERNYRLFVFLADVRSSNFPEITPQFARRGIPKDTSLEEGYIEYLILDEHSFTYAYLDEILNAPWKKFALQDSYFYVFFTHVAPKLIGVYGRLNDEEKRNIRVIMGFDS